jgi:MbtH protein
MLRAFVRNVEGAGIGPGLAACWSVGIIIGMRITVANPFEDPDASYRVLVNHEGQYSLWPATHPTPQGWTVAHDTDSRANCLEYIEKTWTDMRPKSLIEAQGG